VTASQPPGPRQSPWSTRRYAPERERERQGRRPGHERRQPRPGERGEREVRDRRHGRVEARAPVPAEPHHQRALADQPVPPPVRSSMASSMANCSAHSGAMAQ
jgi:hypothetical protein